MARPERFELPTLWFEARCSIQLSYGRVPRFYHYHGPTAGASTRSMGNEDFAIGSLESRVLARMRVEHIPDSRERIEIISNIPRPEHTLPPGTISGFSVVKNTKLTEGVQPTISHREMLDVFFNRRNFGDPTNTVTSAAFGKILSTRFPVGDFGSARQIQLALKVLF